MKQICKNPKVTSGYEEKRNIKLTNGKTLVDIHNGLDIISTTNNREIYALYDGKVLDAFKDSTGCNVIITAHGGVLPYGATLLMLHAHLDEFKKKKGDVVKKGEVIGLYGSTGNVTGAHIHLATYMIPPKVWHTKKGTWYKYDYNTRDNYEINPNDIVN